MFISWPQQAFNKHILPQKICWYKREAISGPSIFETSHKTTKNIFKKDIGRNER